MRDSVIYTDDTGREWQVREIVSYQEMGTIPGEFPEVVRTAVIFECEAVRRIADDAPLDWRGQPKVIAALFVRARPPSREY
jgi:hypothetical protein